MKKHVFYIGILSMLILSNCREDEQFNNKEHLHKNTEVLYRNSDTISIPNIGHTANIAALLFDHNPFQWLVMIHYLTGDITHLP